VMSMDVVGLLHFKSAGWWLGAVSGVAMAQMPLPIAVPATAAALRLAVLAYLRPKRAVQSCNVDQNGALTLMRGDVRIPFLNHYRYIRLYSAKNRAIYLSEHAGAVSRREAKHVDVDGQCPVSTGRRRARRLFLQPLADCRRFLCRAARPGCPVYQACVRAGHTPTQRNNFFISPGWDVRPQ